MNLASRRAMVQWKESNGLSIAAQRLERHEDDGLEVLVRRLLQLVAHRAKCSTHKRFDPTRMCRESCTPPGTPPCSGTRRRS